MKVTIQLINQTEENLLDCKDLKKIAKNALLVCNQKKAKVSLSVFYVNEDKIQEINKDYRNKDKATDVISFRMIDNPDNFVLCKKNFPVDWDYADKCLYIGEIFICKQVAEKQAEEWKHSLNREVAELFAHGMLHLLGHDHEEEQERQKMKEKEVLICKKLDKFVL
ncbi:MAG: rRNA maturation RNase YbeY [Clostridia bacterium]|nr:rRNA maturation RNase YbeY [Clostridia bacterium]